MYKKNLWDLFLMTGDLNFYLEMKSIDRESNCVREENENIEFRDTQNIWMR